MAKLMLYTKRTRTASNPTKDEYHDTKEELVSVDGAKVALILIDIWDNHWCPSIARQTDHLAKQVRAVLPLIRSNGVLIIHSPSDAGPRSYYDPTIPCVLADPKNPKSGLKYRTQPDDKARRKAFLDAPIVYSDPNGQKIMTLPDDNGFIGDPKKKPPVSPPVRPGIGNFPPELSPKYKRLNPVLYDQGKPPKLVNQVCPEKASSSETWTRQNWRIVIKEPDIIAFDCESYKIVKFLEGRGIEHLVYAGTATNYCILWSRNTSMYNMKNAIQKVAKKPIQLYIARDLTDSCYVPDSNTIETHDVGTVESVGAIEALGFPSILSSDLAVAET
jgi:nicotinamidase-related amidase